MVRTRLSAHYLYRSDIYRIGSDYFYVGSRSARAVGQFREIVSPQLQTRCVALLII